MPLSPSPTPRRAAVSLGGILLASALLVVPAKAEETKAEETKPAAVPARAEAESAALVLYVFGASGLPTGDFRVEGLEARPGDDGALRVKRPPGAAELVLLLPEQTGARRVPLGLVPLKAGGETEVLVGFDETGAPSVRIEAPAGLPPPPAPLEGERDELVLEPTCERARIEGHITSLEGGAPVSGVTVIVRGGDVETRTDAKGAFVLDVPPGTHALSFIHAEHSAEVRDGVVARCDEAATIAIELTPRAGTLETFVVKVPHVAGTVAAATSERRNASTITEVLGSEQMSRSGDSDAASALRRVTGLTVVGGKYVYVRGLGERYSSTRMNGSSLPSPEPERRVVPLDLFPAGVLDGMVIKKTYSPDLPGEFGGGTVELKTRDIPEEFTLKLGVGMSGILGTTFQEGLDYPGGPLDLLGFDAGHRALPGPVREASRDQQLLSGDQFSDRGYTLEELEAFGESLPNVWSPSRALIPPGFSLSGELGDRFELGDVTLGYLGAVNFGNSYRTLRYHEDILMTGQGAKPEVAHSYDFEQTEMATDAGGVLTLGALLGDDHKLTATSFLGRITDDEARVYEGRNRDVSTDIRVTRLRFVERTLLAEQLRGEHLLPDLFGAKVDWGYTYALALRSEPDRRETRFDREPGTDRWVISDRPEGNQRFFSELTDHSHDAQLSTTLPFTQWNGLGSNVKVGAAFATKSRDVDTRRFKFQHKGPRSGDPKVIYKPGDRTRPEEIFVPENIGADGFHFEEFTQATDNYSASQVVAAGFAMTDLALWHGLLLQGGVRLEYGSQQVTTFELFNPDAAPIQADITTLDVLPAANLSWAMLEDMQLRAGFSVTVSRPDFRELSPATFNDVTGGRQVQGNPDLERALIYAGDLRWEWYPALGTNVSAALFYKHFEDPIEQVVIPSAQQTVTFQNAMAADNVGVEVEGRFDLGVAHEVLEGLFVAGNVALIYSRVTLDPTSPTVSTSKERALQGQSPYVVNAQVGYDSEDLGLSTTLLYNVYGPRISEVGAQGLPDAYEEPFHSLDVVLKQRLPWGFSVGLKARNLIDLPQVKTQGAHVVSSIQRGRELSLALSWSY